MGGGSSRMRREHTLSNISSNPTSTKLRKLSANESPAQRIYTTAVASELCSCDRANTTHEPPSKRTSKAEERSCCTQSQIQEVEQPESLHTCVSVWEAASLVSLEQLQHTPPPKLAAGVSVSLQGVPGQPQLDGSGATVLEMKGEGSWRVQSEYPEKAPFDVPTTSISPLPPLPKDGVSLACLRSFREAHPALFRADGWKTTTDACLEVVMPITKRAHASLSTIIKHLGLTDVHSNPFVAPATVFVSHAWRYRVLDVFDALEEFCTKRAAAYAADNVVAPPVYFWFDLFVNDQHDAVSLPQLWWREAFLDGVRQIGHTCLVLAPWHDPIPLTRAWCLWEILSTMRMGATLSVQMVPTEAESFGKALEEDFDHVYRAVANIDGRRAEAFQKSDQRMIISAVLQTVGFTELNALISSRMREWLIEQGYARLDLLSPQARAASRLIHNLGRLLHEQGRLEAAERLMTEAVQAGGGSSAGSTSGGGTSGQRHDMNTLSRQNNLARLYRGMDRMDEAEQLFRQTLEGYRQLEALNGIAPGVDSITTMNNLAELLQSKGRDEEAEPMLYEALNAARANLEENENVYLTILNNLASLHEHKGDLEQAESLFQEALAARKKSPRYGVRHPTTLLVSTNLANVCKKRGKVVDAEKLYREALTTKTETMGAHHESTLKSLNNLAVFLIEQRKLRDAVPMLQQALEGYVEAMGVQHPDTITLLRNYVQVLWNVGRGKEALELTKTTLDQVQAVQGNASSGARGLASTYVALLTAVGDAAEAASVKIQFSL